MLQGEAQYLYDLAQTISLIFLHDNWTKKSNKNEHFLQYPLTGAFPYFNATSQPLR